MFCYYFKHQTLFSFWPVLAILRAETNLALNSSFVTYKGTIRGIISGMGQRYDFE